jgi:hypothetical protein
MIASHRNLLVGAVALTKGRLPGSGQAILAARNSIEQALVQHKFLAGAPFRTVSLILRYGDKDDLNPEFGALDTRNQELPVAVEMSLARLKTLSPSQLEREFRAAIIEVLCDVAANYDLPFEFLDAMRELNPTVAPSPAHR